MIFQLLNGLMQFVPENEGERAMMDEAAAGLITFDGETMTINEAQWDHFTYQINAAAAPEKNDPPKPDAPDPATVAASQSMGQGDPTATGSAGDPPPQPAGQGDPTK